VSTLHAHAESSSRDCDGDYTSGNVYEMTTLEKAASLGDLEFKDRVITNIISVHAHGTLTVKPTGVSWHEQTDEGYRHTDVEWCEDECADKRTWQRDHRAEAMGY
jgi:hypothetical protein